MSSPSPKAVELVEAVELYGRQYGAATVRGHALILKMPKRDLLAHIADLERRVAEAEANADAMREWAAGWILRARETYCYREGWEEGMTAQECGEALTDVLANLGCDAGTENPEQVKEAARLLALDLPHAPPTRKGA